MPRAVRSQRQIDRMLEQRAYAAKATTLAKVDQVAATIPPDYGTELDALNARVTALENPTP